MKKASSRFLMEMAVIATIAIQSAVSSAQTNIDAGAAGQAVHREILGSTLAHSRYVTTGDKASAIGVAGGLEAELFNWQTLQNNFQWPAYGFMKTAADMDSTFIDIVNMRGVYDSSNAYKTDLAPLVTLASDWVRYTNHIIQTYHQGDAVAPADQAILNKINWTAYPQKLPNPGETAPPPVKYWIIGNEPEIKVNGKWFSSNFIDTTFGGAWTTAEYVNRYTQITNAMKAQDPTIKVGPGMLDNVTDTAMPLLNSGATIDSWAYHPYDDISDDYVPNGNASQVNTMESRLRNVRAKQLTKYNNQRNAFIAAGRNPDNVEFMATEYNPMNVDVADADKPSMYQALGFTETIFAFAQVGLKSANYWGETVKKPDIPNPNPADIYPMVKAWWKLRDEMGDVLVDSIIDDANNRRIYTTKDSQTGEISIWGLNFDNDVDTSINLSLSGITAADTAMLSVLGGTGTKLWTTSEEWTTQSLSNFNAGNFNLSIPSASIVLLEVSPVPEPGSLGVLGIGLFGLTVRRSRR